ncbi:hypothetical protein [Vibrio hepatarius]|uniref:hypothetical protein n=1 Tax=Vibrio hepatarius TaxID=171383 RepID=UPI001C09D8CA|nr:hypothetical protein [Vibrio hepatarius]MBU2896871.1 hypothetical protein [Vibrio hepatarius]
MNSALVTRRFLALLFFLASAFSVTPIYIYFFGNNGNIFSLLICFILSCLFIAFRKINLVLIIYLVFIVALAIILAFYWLDAKLVYFPIYFLMSSIVVSYIREDELRYIVGVFSNILIFIIIFSFIGFIYSILGGDPNITFDYNGRRVFLYLTTLTNWSLYGLIRPAGIFDEPGALSFFICFICASRHMLGFSKQKTWFLILGGMITLSVAQVIYAFIHLLQEERKVKYSISKVVLIASFFPLFLLAIFSEHHVVDLLYDNFIGRFMYDENIGIVGNNRAEHISNSIDLINLDSFFWGVSSSCITDINLCNSSFKSFGENPLSLLNLLGIGLSHVYYLVVIFFIIFGLKFRHDLCILGLALLLLQRPNIMSFGYSLIICLSIKIVIEKYLVDDGVPKRNQPCGSWI